MPPTYASPTIVDEYLDNFFPPNAAEDDPNKGPREENEYRGVRMSARAMLYAALRRHHVLP